jgi:hypothetical protein
MAQKPVVSPESVAASRDPVVREVFGVASTYAGMSAAHKAAIDTTLNDAFMEVVNRGKWFADIDPASADMPAEWNELFRQMAVAKLKRQFRSASDYGIHWRLYVEPLQERIADAYASSWRSTKTLASDDVSAVAMRAHVMHVLVRQRHPVFAAPEEIDRTIREEFRRLWSARWWRFRKRMLKVTINTVGDMVSASGLAISAIASTKFSLDGDSAAGSCRSDVTWLDATRAAEAASAYDGTTGRPRYFYETFRDGKPAITFLPLPDQSYEAHVAVYIDAPSFTPSGVPGDVDGLRMLPPDMRGHLRDRVIAHLVSANGKEDNDAARLTRKVETDFAMYCGQWDDGGPSLSAAAPHHMARTLAMLPSARGGVIGPIG